MALQALQQQTIRNWNGAVVEIDIRKYFNRIPHGELMELLRNKISDRRFLRLTEALITAPVLENGNILSNEIGCPQGSILSPVLANISCTTSLTNGLLKSAVRIFGERQA